MNYLVFCYMQALCEGMICPLSYKSYTHVVKYGTYDMIALRFTCIVVIMFTDTVGLLGALGPGLDDGRGGHRSGW